MRPGNGRVFQGAFGTGRRDSAPAASPLQMPAGRGGSGASDAASGSRDIARVLGLPRRTPVIVQGWRPAPTGSHQRGPVFTGDDAA